MRLWSELPLPWEEGRKKQKQKSDVGREEPAQLCSDSYPWNRQDASSYSILSYCIVVVPATPYN